MTQDQGDETAATGEQANAANACPLPPGFRRAEKSLLLQDVVAGADEQKPTLVNLWALWCVPCRTELPLLDNLSTNQAQMAVHVLNLGDEDTGIDELFNALDIRHLGKAHAPDDALDLFGAVGLPFTAFFIQGKLYAVKAGVIEESDSLLAFAQCSNQ